MLTDDEAAAAYSELIGQLEGLGAADLVENIAILVSEGVTQYNEGRPPTQQSHSPQQKLILAVRMLTAWLEIVLLAAEAGQTIQELTGMASEVLWRSDSVNLESAENDQRVRPRLKEEVLDIPTMSQETANILRERIAELQKFTSDLEIGNGNHIAE